MMATACASHWAQQGEGPTAGSWRVRKQGGGDSHGGHVVVYVPHLCLNHGGCPCRQRFLLLLLLSVWCAHPLLWSGCVPPGSHCPTPGTPAQKQVIDTPEIVG